MIRSLKLALAVVLASAGAPAVRAAGYADALAKAAGFRAFGSTLTLPFVMVREYPFVTAIVNGVPGKLLLDTGAPEALIIDDRRVPLHDQTPAGSSFFGSGQHYEERMNARIDSVTLDGCCTFRNVTRVPSQDALQLERHITPDFLGWLGYGFFQGYAMKLDYRRRLATFYRNEPGSVARFLAGERVLGRLPFTPRRRPDDPIVPATLGGVPFTAAFDTGQYGTIYTSEAVKRRLEQEGSIRPAGVRDGDIVYDIAPMALEGVDIGATPKVEVTTAPFPPAAGMGIGEPNIITIGYGVLSRFKTVWDFPNHTIYLLAP